MRTRWTEGLDPEAKKDIEGVYKGATLLRRRFIQMMEEKCQETMNEAISKANYNSPNWSHFHADKMGYIRGLKEAADFFKEKED